MYLNAKAQTKLFSLQNTSMQTFQFSHAAFLKQKTKRNEVICKYFMFYCIVFGDWWDPIWNSISSSQRFAKKLYETKWKSLSFFNVQIYRSGSLKSWISLLFFWFQFSSCVPYQYHFVHSISSWRRCHWPRIRMSFCAHQKR